MNVRKWCGNCLALGLLIMSSQVAMANTMSVQWNDPKGDFGTVGDVLSASLSFNSSGAWTATWYADAAHPFTGNARFNLNLFDLALGNPLTAHAPQVSLDGFHNFGTATALIYSYSGTTPFLSNWHVGDKITSGNYTNFLSGAVNMNYPYGRDNMVDIGTVMATPLPASFPLLLSGIGVLGFAARRKR